MKLTLKRHTEDSRLIMGISGDHDRPQLWENKLYLKYRYLIKDAAWRHKLTEDDASMAYSDTILSIIKQVRTRHFEEKSSLKTYINKIYQNKCIDRIRAGQTNKERGRQLESLEDYLDVVPANARDIIQHLSEKYEVARLQERISRMDAKCKQILMAWGEGYHDQEIAADLGYLSSAVAKTSRLRCLSKLKKMYNIADVAGSLTKE
ncbi:RNA polymerase sigma factor [Pedobacter sp. SAFR-022]